MMFNNEFFNEIMHNAYQNTTISKEEYSDFLKSFGIKGPSLKESNVAFIIGFDSLAKAASEKAMYNPDWLKIGGKIYTICNYQHVPDRFSKTIDVLKEILHPAYIEFVREHSDELDAMIDYSLDLNYDYLAVRTLNAGYLKSSIINNDRRCRETIQYMNLRIAVWIMMHSGRNAKDFKTHSNKDSNTYAGGNRNGVDGVNNGIDVVLRNIKAFYDYISQDVLSCASPTIYNAGTIRPQLASCFLFSPDDSTDEIGDMMSVSAKISAGCGGIGMSLSSFRHHQIKGGGNSKGVKSIIELEDTILDKFDQGGVRRGSFAGYLEMHHIDIVLFLNYITPRLKEIFQSSSTALWICDYFMRCVRDDKDWWMFCPSTANIVARKHPELAETRLEYLHNEEYDQVYELYIKLAEESIEFYKNDSTTAINTVNNDDSKNYFQPGSETVLPQFRKMPARELYEKVLDCTRENGKPYIMFKDSCNRYSNQQFMGTIRCSNLCTEIVEYNTMQEIASCNLMSVCLPKFVERDVTCVTFNYQLLYEAVVASVKALDVIIDVSEIRKSIQHVNDYNKLYRPLGIGIQGLADVFMELNIEYLSDEASDINYNIAMVMYLAFLDASSALAVEKGSHYRFDESPLSKGKFQYTMYEHDPKIRPTKFCKNLEKYTSEYIKSLESRAVKGMRHSLGMAPMPTATSSMIKCNTPCFQPATFTIGRKTTANGIFTQCSFKAIDSLRRNGLYSKELMKELFSVKSKGSISRCDMMQSEECKKYKNLYLSAWDITKKKKYCIQARDRQYFTCQSQSFNLWIEDNPKKHINNRVKWCWKFGLKTATYYVRSRSALERMNVAMASIESANTIDSKGNGNENKASIDTIGVSTPTPKTKVDIDGNVVTTVSDTENTEEICISCGS